MAPYSLGGAAPEGACDVHPVRGFEEDDLGSQGVLARPAAGGGERDGYQAVHLDITMTASGTGRWAGLGWG
jgi:hypothetical protein